MNNHIVIVLLMAVIYKQDKSCGCSPLRVTTWPLGVIEPGFESYLLRWTDADLVGDWLFLPDGEHFELVKPEPDLYFRHGLYADVSRPETALGIVREGWGDWEQDFGGRDAFNRAMVHALEHGRIGCDPSFRGLRDDDPVKVSDWAKMTGRSPRLRDSMNRASIRPEFRRDDPRPNGEQLELKEWMLASDEMPTNRGHWVHVDSVLWQVSKLREIAQVVLAAKGEVCVLASYMESEGRLPASGNHHYYAAHHLLQTFEIALQGWSPKVWAEFSEQEEPETKEYQSSLLGVGALQAFNDLVESVAIKPCAHCGRWFGRKAGEAKYRSRRKGVIYCSKSCANAATQARYRARRKAERQEEQGGGEGDE